MAFKAGFIRVVFWREMPRALVDRVITAAGCSVVGEPVGDTYTVQMSCEYEDAMIRRFRRCPEVQTAERISEEPEGA